MEMKRKPSKLENYYLSLLKKLYLEYKDREIPFRKGFYGNPEFVIRNVDGRDTDFRIKIIGKELTVYSVFNGNHSRDWHTETHICKTTNKQVWAIAKEFKGKGNGTYMDFEEIEDGKWIKVRQEDD